ncbi:hypothetical protein D3C81_1456970 [compost metagenome]
MPVGIVGADAQHLRQRAQQHIGRTAQHEGAAQDVQWCGGAGHGDFGDHPVEMARRRHGARAGLQAHQRVGGTVREQQHITGGGAQARIAHSDLDLAFQDHVIRHVPRRGLGVEVGPDPRHAATQVHGARRGQEAYEFAKTVH